jgi:hypothetical protein
MPVSFSPVLNQPALRGELAAEKQYLGPVSRFSVAPVHTRFDCVEWFVWDAWRTDAEGMSTVLRQSNTLAHAIQGLETQDEGMTQLSATQREHHYVCGGAHQYWECLAGTEWVQVSKEQGEDWPRDTGAIEWAHAIPKPPRAGMPPRVMI